MHFSTLLVLLILIALVAFNRFTFGIIGLEREDVAGVILDTYLILCMTLAMVAATIMMFGLDNM